MKNVVCLFALMFWTSISYAQIIDIPDANFKNALLNTLCVDLNEDNIGDIDADENNDGEIDILEVSQIKALYLIKQNINNLKGIEYFTSIKTLDCSQNNLTELIFSNHSSLYNLKCSSNKITKLLLSDLNSFTKLNCSFNKLTQLTLTNLPNLESIYTICNTINKLTLSNLPNLKYLTCTFNSLSKLALSDFPNLLSLECSNNILTQISLINLPKLKTISSIDNYITKLVITDLPELKEIQMIRNKLSQITISNLPKLSILSCGYNDLTNLSLSDLPSLKSLSCHNNKLKQLTLSRIDSLMSLDCSNNEITQLTISDFILLNSLKCANNMLTQLQINNLPFLTSLICSNNKLTHLPISNLSSLNYLTCANNQLSDLSVSELKLMVSLNCSNNQITQLSISGLNNLETLNCLDNPLINLFAKFGKSKNFNGITINNSVKYICTDDINISILKMKYPNANINSYCTFTPGGKFFSILGNTLLDKNKNGCQSSDKSFPNLKFDILSTNANGTLVSNSLGNYYIPVQEGTHTIKPILEYPEYYNASPDSIIVTFPSTSDSIIQDFCITPKGIHKQVDLSIIPLTPPARPGFNTQYKVVMTNKGNQLENGTLYFAYDEPRMDFVSTDVTPSTQSDGLISWNFTDLLPFETRYYNVTLNVNSPGENPPVNAGDELLITCNILDNVFLLRQEVVGSYDPNDKTCLEGKTITPEQVGEYVHYLIRFENTGNYAAENVVVKDVIDESTFDISTLQITDASHESWARINGNIVEFIFENIQLPFDDETNDGYICFNIKTKPTLVLGNELKNEANIYFDYNLPILTNKTNTVVANLVGTDEAIEESDIEIFPNPVSDVLKFSGAEKILKVEIFDMSGRLVQVSSVVNGEANVERLLSGVYQLKVYTRIGVRNSKMVKI